ncbi:hypothetical protein, partial [Bacillus cereus]|uniref:hypothetical protein n=1 Tax=Bacillus cereus TaxID=1396 RepID=UPI0034D769F4
FVSLTIGDGNDVALIVLSGGGSYLFEDFFKRDFPSNLEVADDRSFTNAKGFYKALAHIV